jgi:anti-anti-sigma factor
VRGHFASYRGAGAKPSPIIAALPGGHLYCLANRHRATHVAGGEAKGARRAMEFAQEQAGEVAIVKLAGRLDSSAAQPAEESFTQMLGSGTPRLAIDMSRLEYISSAGLRVLLVVAKKVQQAKGKMVLFGLVPNVREVFSVSGFDKIFAIQADADAAVASVR